MAAHNTISSERLSDIFNEGLDKLLSIKLLNEVSDNKITILTQQADDISEALNELNGENPTKLLVTLVDNFNLSVQILEENHAMSQQQKHTQQLLRQSEEVARRERKLARVDALTDTGNGRALKERLKEVVQSTETDQANGIYRLFVKLDLDRFKGINDSLGHDAGDQCLKEFSNILSQFVRSDNHPKIFDPTSGQKDEERLEDELFLKPVDTYRDGGDEFAIIVNIEAINIDDANEKCDRVEERLRNHLAVNSFKYQGKVTPIVSSFGAYMMMPGDSVDEIQKEADIKLYEDKNPLSKDARWSHAIRTLIARGAGNVHIPEKKETEYKINSVRAQVNGTEIENPADVIFTFSA